MAVEGSGAETERGRPGDLSVTTGDVAGREFAQLLDHRDVHVVFQPVVDLRSGEIVGVEALARGPQASPFATPGALFAAARQSGRVAELDWVCRAAAFRVFLEADLPPAVSLFVNIEPEALSEQCPHDLEHFVTRAESVLRVFVEVNDRALATDPAGVLAAVDRARATGWGIAIDDVGASRAPVAMLPLVHPDLVKLDLRLLSEASPADSSAIITSALRHVENTGASLLVEGIENEADARWARALGATYGQGFHLGPPGPLHDQYSVPRAPIRLIDATWARSRVDSPFQLVAHGAHQRVDKGLLGQLMRVILNSLPSTGTSPVVLACVGRDGELDEDMVEHVLGLTRQALLFVMFGADPSADLPPGVRGVGVRPLDPLADERFLIVLSDQVPIALLARSASDGLLDVVLTQDPELVHAVAHHLIRRVPGPGQGDTALPVPARDLEPDHAEGDQASIAPGDTSKRGWRQRRGPRT
jgi:EAL domain-containing protein (putative c-di-GMP-specific phosphodiesterase class I)